MSRPRHAFLVLLALLVPASAFADEPAGVRGRVVDGATDDPIEGATIIVRAGEHTVASAVSGADGRFDAPEAPPGPIELSVYAGGYLPWTITVSAAGREGDHAIALTPDGTGELIEITGEAPELAQPTIYELDQDQVRSLPGTGNDILRAVQSLPGVGRVSFGLGGLVLRGANPGDTDVYMDGIEVPLAFHFGGVSSFYPSSLLHDMVVTPGGSEVSRGRGIGGVVELRSRAPRGDRWRVGGELGVMDASSYAEGAVAGGSIAFGIRRSYIDAILPSVMSAEDLIIPHYYDGQLRWDRELRGGTLTALVFFSDDQIRFVEKDGVFENSFARAALRYRRREGATTVTVTPWLGATAFTLSSSDTDDSQTKIRHLPFGARADVIRDTAWGHVAAGIDMQGARSKIDRPLYNDPDYETMPVYERTLRWHGDAAVWAETRWRIDGGKLTLKPGARLGYFALSGQWVVDPRAVITHELTDWFTLRETFGLYHEPPSARDQAPYPDPRRSIHASVGTDLQLSAAARASVTAYHMEYDGEKNGAPLSFDGGGDEFGEGLELFGWGGLGVVVSNILGSELGLEASGRGRSQGLEVSVQRRDDRSLYWLSYTLSRSEYLSQDGSAYLSNLDQTHNLNAVASWRLGRWQLGARFRYVTGFPYTPRYDVIGENGLPETEQGEHNAARVVAFASLDLRVDRSWRRPWGTVAFFVDLQNATNATNSESAHHDEDGKHVRHGLPIFPMIGVSFTPP